MATFQTEEDVEDFGAIRLPGRSHSDVLLYIYPTSNRSGTFRVMRLPEKSVLAEWVEKQAPSRFFIGPYETIESVAYFRNNVLVIRSGMGEILKEVLIPQSEFVGSLIGLARISSYLVVVGSGSASTQNHLVVVLDAKDQIVYEEIASGHAVKLATSGVDDRFEVWTETTKWQYRLPSTKQ
jgi:hypothetical protein